MSSRYQHRFHGFFKTFSFPHPCLNRQSGSCESSLGVRGDSSQNEFALSTSIRWLRSAATLGVLRRRLQAYDAARDLRTFGRKAGGRNRDKNRKPCCICGNSQVEIGKAVHKNSAAPQSCAQLNPIARSAQSLLKITESQTEESDDRPGNERGAAESCFGHSLRVVVLCRIPCQIRCETLIPRVHSLETPQPRPQPGMIAALHTWSHILVLHPHVHCLVTGGGLTPAGQWVAVRHGFLLPVRVVMAVFRGKMLDALRQAVAQDALGLPEAMRPQAREQRNPKAPSEDHSWAA